MNPSITIELQFFLISILWGGILLLAYDILRIIRRLIPHDGFFIALEDLIYWVIASLFIFAMIYRVNDGVIRGFSALGVILGGVLYHYSVSDLLVQGISSLLHLIMKFLKVLLSPFRLAAQKITKFLKFVLLKGKRIINKLLFRLKNKVKSVKIALSKKKASAKEQSAAKKQLAAKKKKAAGKKPSGKNRPVEKRINGKSPATGTASAAGKKR